MTCSHLSTETAERNDERKRSFVVIKVAVLQSRSRGAEIKLPPGAEAEIMNCGTDSFLLI
jgi:hypothetical protein